jgi:hypothetical protein
MCKCADVQMCKFVRAISMIEYSLFMLAYRKFPIVINNHVQTNNYFLNRVQVNS